MAEQKTAGSSNNQDINISTEVTKDGNVKVNIGDASEPSPIEQMIAKDVMSAKDEEFMEFSIEKTIANTMDKIKKLAEAELKDEKSPHAKSFKDAYGNTLTATGNNDMVKKFANYGITNDTMNYMLWMALYNDSWVFARAIDKPAQDQIRCGITIISDAKIEEMTTEYKKHSTDLINLIKWGRLFGGAIAVILLKGTSNKDLKNPIDYDKIDEKTVIRLYVTDRWYGVAQHGSQMVSDLADIDYGKPMYYDITFADGKTYVVHHSRVMRYEHRDAPQLIKQGYLQGWGYAEGSHIINELYRDDQLKSAITSLVNKSLIEIIKMSGMRGIFNGAVNKKGEEQLRKRLEMVNWGRTFNSLTFLDKDDDYQASEFNVGGLADLLDRSMRIVAAAENMSGILFGDLDGGFSADEVAMERYDNENLSNCETYDRKPITKLLYVIAAKYGIKKENFSFEFNSLLMKKQDAKRLEGLSSFQSIISQTVADGMLTISQGLEALDTYVKKGVIDFGLKKEDIEKVKKDEANQMENINFDPENDEDDETKETDKTKSTKQKDARRRLFLFRRH